MGQFLNNKEPYDKYRMVMNGTYFVDKSEILEELIPALQQEQRFFCITRPRRFGKTIMANMIAAFLKIQARIHCLIIFTFQNMISIKKRQESMTLYILILAKCRESVTVTGLI